MDDKTIELENVAEIANAWAAFVSQGKLKRMMEFKDFQMVEGVILSPHCDRFTLNRATGDITILIRGEQVSLGNYYTDYQ